MKRSHRCDRHNERYARGRIVHARSQNGQDACNTLHLRPRQNLDRKSRILFLVAFFKRNLLDHGNASWLITNDSLCLGGRPRVRPESRRRTVSIYPRIGVCIAAECFNAAFQEERYSLDGVQKCPLKRILGARFSEARETIFCPGVGFSKGVTSIENQRALKLVKRHEIQRKRKTHAPKYRLFLLFSSFRYFISFFPSLILSDAPLL